MRFLIAWRQFAWCVNSGGVESFFFNAHLHLICYAAEAYIRVFSLNAEIVIEIGILNVIEYIDFRGNPQWRRRVAEKSSSHISPIIFYYRPVTQSAASRDYFQITASSTFMKGESWLLSLQCNQAVKINTVSNLEYLTLRANAKFRSALRFPNEIHKQIYESFAREWKRYFAPRICLVNEKGSNGILFIVVLEDFLRESPILNSLRRIHGIHNFDVYLCHRMINDAEGAAIDFANDLAD